MMKKAELLGLNDAKASIASIQYSPDQLARMPEKVARIGGSSTDELDIELEVEQEQEVEQEEELEVSLETENEKVAAKGLGYFPVRVFDEVDHSVKEKIHPAYDPKIFVADTFLPLSRQGTASLRQRAAFDDAMFPAGLIKIEFKIVRTPTDYSVYPFVDYPDRTEIDKVILCDYIDDIKQGYPTYYDLRSDTFVNVTPSSDIRSSWKSTNIQAIQAMQDFQPLIAQIKFFDGRASGYTEKELQLLSEWLKQNNPTAMKEHFLNQILRNRYKERLDFEGSQLDTLFSSLKG